MEFVVIARYRALPGQEERVAAALRNMQQPSRAEPGNLEYRAHRDPGDAAVFVLYERYTGADAFQAHLGTAHFATWMTGDVLPNLAERTRYDLIPLGA